MSNPVEMVTADEAEAAQSHPVRVHVSAEPNATEDNERAQDNAMEMALTLLGQTARNDIVEMSKLLKRGIDPNGADYDQRTPLHIAASSGFVEAIELLLQQPNMNVNPFDTWGATPLDDAYRHSHQDVIDQLKVAGATYGKGTADVYVKEFLEAANSNDVVKGSKMLNDQQVSVDSTLSVDNRTALHVAVARGHVEFAQMLIKDHAASVSVQDSLGFTALDEVGRHMLRTGYDPMRDLFAQFLKDSKRHSMAPHALNFVILFSVLQVVMIVIFFTICEYSEEAAGKPHRGAHGEVEVNSIRHLYGWFQDIHVMIFVGFGFLMAFLRKHAFSSIGLTFLIGGFCIQWHIIWEGLLHNLINGHWEGIHLSLETVILGDFCAGAVLITFGVMLGKVSPMQMLSIGVLETIFFTINEEIGLVIGITDLGGSMVVHMFGAFFGMGVALLDSAHSEHVSAHNASVYHSDVFAMIGSVFLWMYWPSFNAALAGDPTQQHRAVVNTILSLCGSCVAAFLASYYMRGKRFDMVDIQNATLAGGVAMGTACDLLIGPGAALLVGVLAGLLSVIGYIKIQPFLERKINLDDTCGVNNLHGMPSLLGAIVGIIATASISQSSYEPTQLASIYEHIASGARSPQQQALLQLAFMGITLGISLLGGFVTGAIVRLPLFAPLPNGEHYQDSLHWEVPELELPYYFDHRGEVSREKSDRASANPKGAASAAHVKSLEAKVLKLEKLIANQSAPPQQQTLPMAMPYYSMQPPQPSSRLEEMLGQLVSHLSTKEGLKQL